MRIVEQPKKYYWRKKKEHLASFEKTNKIYLNFNNSHKKIFLEDIKETIIVNTKFTEQEARELLKNDFDMFERVEV